MDFRHYLNDEGMNNSSENEYNVITNELDKDIYSVDNLMDEIYNVVGDINVDEIADGFYVITCNDEQLLDVINICNIYEDVFYDEYEEEYEEEY